MMPRGVKTLFMLSFLFFLFVIGFLMIEQRQDVLLTGKNLRQAKQAIAFLDTQLQEIMMEKAKLSFVTLPSSLEVITIGYRDVYRVVLSENGKTEETNKKIEGILQVCLEWIKEHIPGAKIEI